MNAFRHLLLCSVMLVLSASCTASAPSAPGASRGASSAVPDAPAPIAASVENLSSFVDEPLPGACQTGLYLPIIQNEHIAVVANHASIVEGVHLVDTLRALHVQVDRIFSPEHGFRGTADAGAHVDDSRDEATGIAIISLYGNHRKPTKEDLHGIDMVVFDLQDVGVRFYTYISTLHYVMEACAALHVPVLVLDRPNPNGRYVDGPVLEPDQKSFVGMHPVPVVYGMTIGEYARMINGEHWLDGGIQCQLQVIPCRRYTHHSRYHLPVPPSPNLPDDQAIALYPSLCFFEGTPLSVGRGTDSPFKLFGHPDLPDTGFSFLPHPTSGASNPPQNGKVCFGTDLRDYPSLGISRLELGWVLSAYKNFPDPSKFFTSYFTTLAGTATLRKQIENGLSEDEIRASWQPALEAFKRIRSNYLIYEE